MVAVSVYPFLTGDGAFGVACIVAFVVHHVGAGVDFTFLVSQPFAFATEITDDDNLVIQLPTVAVFYTSALFASQYIPPRVVEVGGGAYFGDGAMRFEALLKAFVVGVVVEIAHDNYFAVRDGGCNGVFQMFYAHGSIFTGWRF